MLQAAADLSGKNWMLVWNTNICTRVVFTLNQRRRDFCVSPRGNMIMTSIWHLTLQTRMICIKLPLKKKQTKTSRAVSHRDVIPDTRRSLHTLTSQWSVGSLKGYEWTDRWTKGRRGANIPRRKCHLWRWRMTRACKRHIKAETLFLWDFLPVKCRLRNVAPCCGGAVRSSLRSPQGVSWAQRMHSSIWSRSPLPAPQSWYLFSNEIIRGGKAGGSHMDTAAPGSVYYLNKDPGERRHWAASSMCWHYGTVLKAMFNKVTVELGKYPAMNYLFLA